MSWPLCNYFCFIENFYSSSFEWFITCSLRKNLFLKPNEPNNQLRAVNSSRRNTFLWVSPYLAPGWKSCHWTSDMLTPLGIMEPYWKVTLKPLGVTGCRNGQVVSRRGFNRAPTSCREASVSPNRCRINFEWRQKMYARAKLRCIAAISVKTC